MKTVLFIVGSLVILAAVVLYFLADSARVGLLFGPLSGIQFLAKSILGVVVLAGFLYFMGHIFGLV